MASIIPNPQPPTMVSAQEIFFMLSLIIPGPESVKMSNFDVYFGPYPKRTIGTLEGGGRGGYNVACRETGLYIEGNSVVDNP